MRYRILSIRLASILVVAGLAFYAYGGAAVKRNIAVKRTDNKRAGVHGPFFGDMRRLGEEAASLAEAERRIGRKIKVPDAELIGGGQPMIRTGDGDGVSLIYPNDLVVGSMTQSSWPPGMGPREFYAASVKQSNEDLDSTETANLPNRPENLNIKYRLLEIAGNPGQGREKDYQLIEGKRNHPLPAYVIWAQDDIQYTVNGAPGMTLTKVIEIAESVAKSN